MASEGVKASSYWIGGRSFKLLPLASFELLAPPSGLDDWPGSVVKRRWCQVEKFCFLHVPRRTTAAAGALPCDC